MREGEGKREGEGVEVRREGKEGGGKGEDKGVTNY